MIACKCGRKFKDSMPRPINCACGQSIVLRVQSDITEIIDRPNTSTLWHQLHSYKYIDKEQCLKFYEDWYSRIPNFGCACKDHWTEIVKKLPPNFNSACEFFKWGVDAHNLVNEKLDYEQFSYEAAKALYKQDCV